MEPVKACQIADTLAGIRSNRRDDMEIIIGLIILAVVIGYAVCRASGNADEQSEEMYQAMRQEQADAEAYRRLTE